MSESTDCNVVAHPPGVVDLLEHLVDFTHDGLGPLPGQGGIHQTSPIPKE